MSDTDKLEAVYAQAAREAIDHTPLGGILRILGRAFGKPDLADEAVQALQEDVVRLYRLLYDKVSEVQEELRVKTDPLEVAELATQTVTNMGRTASAEKRRL